MDSKTNNSGYEHLTPNQYQDIYHEDDVPLSNVRESAFRYFLYGGLVIIVLFFIVGSTTRMSRTIKSRFTVVSLDREFIVRFFDDVYLQRSFVKPGQKVLAGSPLIQISSAKIASLISSFQKAQVELERFIHFQQPLHEAQLQALRLQQSQKRNEIEQILALRTESELIFKAEKEKYRLSIAGLRSKNRRNRELFARNLIATEALSEVKASYESVVQDSIIFERTYSKQKMESGNSIESLKYEIKILGQRMLEKNNQFVSKNNELEQDKSRLHEEITHRYGSVDIKESSLILMAENPGMLSFMIKQHEGTIAHETTILRLQPGESNFRIVSDIDARDIARVHAASRFKLHFDAYPSSQWGYLEGKITSLNTTPDSKGNYPFEGEIISNQQSEIAPRASLTGTCYIRVNEGIFFKYVFQRVRGAFYDSIQ